MGLRFASNTWRNRQENCPRYLEHVCSNWLLGEYLQSTGDKQLADEAFGEARITEDKASSQVLDEYRRARELAEQSKTAFQTFVKLTPDSWQANVFYGDVARQHKRVQAGALACYRKAADAMPDSPAPVAVGASSMGT